MTCNWIQFVYERNTYVVDLDRIDAIVCAKNGRLRFSLPDGKTEIIVHPQINAEAHQQILDYFERKTGQPLECQSSNANHAVEGGEVGRSGDREVGR